MGEVPVWPMRILQVTGESMLGDGIFPGDLVYVAKTSACASGDLVVAAVAQRFLKRIYFQPDGVELRSSNPAYPSLTIRPPDEYAVLGKVVGIERRI